MIDYLSIMCFTLQIKVISGEKEVKKKKNRPCGNKEGMIMGCGTFGSLENNRTKDK